MQLYKIQHHQHIKYFDDLVQLISYFLVADLTFVATLFTKYLEKGYCNSIVHYLLINYNQCPHSIKGRVNIVGMLSEKRFKFLRGNPRPKRYLASYQNISIYFSFYHQILVFYFTIVVEGVFFTLMTSYLHQNFQRN